MIHSLKPSNPSLPTLSHRNKNVNINCTKVFTLALFKVEEKSVEKT